MYKFVGFVGADYKYVHEPLPDDARLIDMKGLNAKSFIAGLVGILIGYGLLILKQYGFNSGESVLNKPFILLGSVIGALLLTVHELLHLIPYPRKGDKIIVIKNWTPCAYYSGAVSKGEFITSSLLPVVLGAVPLLFFILLPASNEVINTILWTAGTIGLASPARDYVEALICLVKVPAGCSIRSGNGGFYYY